jgi:hypothetical protein
VLLLLSSLIALMPQATLAAVVIVTSVGLIAPGLRGASGAWEGRVSMGSRATLGVITLGTLRGIVVAIILVDGEPAASGERPLGLTCWAASGAPTPFRPWSPEHPERTRRL